MKNEDKQVQKNIRKKEEENDLVLKGIIGVVLLYLLTMIIFPTILYFIFNNHVFEAESDGLILFPASLIFEGNYRIIFYFNLLFFDIIVSFMICRKLLKNKLLKVISIFSILSSPIIKIIIISMIGALPLDIYSITDDIFLKNSESREEYQTYFEYKGENVHKLLPSSLIIEGAMIGKMQIGYWSYGVYIGIVGEMVYEKKKKKK